MDRSSQKMFCVDDPSILHLFYSGSTLSFAGYMFCVTAAHLLVYNQVLFAHEYYTESFTAGEDTYMTDVNTYYSAHLANEDTLDAELITDWDNLFWASNVLLANITGDSASSGSFHQATQAFLKQWVCGSGGVVK